LLLSTVEKMRILTDFDRTAQQSHSATGCADDGSRGESVAAITRKGKKGGAGLAGCGLWAKR